MFNNTSEEWDNLISDCRQDGNFNDKYDRMKPYLHAIYMFNATSSTSKNDYTEPFSVIDVDNYKTNDNNAICFKHIDYTLNKDAKFFKDMFHFTDVNKNVSSNLKANSCYFHGLNHKACPHRQGAAQRVHGPETKGSANKLQ